MKYIIAAIVIVASLAVIDAYEPPKKRDYQNEFDFLLMQRIHEQIKKSETRLLYLQQQINQFKANPTAEMKEQLLNEMDTSLALLDGGIAVVGRQLKRNDLDIFERYNYEMAQKAMETLKRNMKAEEEKIRMIEV